MLVVEQGKWHEEDVMSRRAGRLGVTADHLLSVMLCWLFARCNIKVMTEHISYSLVYTAHQDSTNT